MGIRRDVEDFNTLAEEIAVDDALVRVQQVYPYESWRAAELRDLVGLAIVVPARHHIPRPRTGE